MDRFLVILICASMMLSGCTAINDEVSDEILEILGCTDSEALNFDVNATISDESCLYDETQEILDIPHTCLLYTSPSPRDQRGSRMPSSA